MSKLTIQQRKQLKEICKETLVKKLSQKEAHTYVNSKLLGFDISFDYIQKTRNEISKSAKEELLYLEKDQYALIQSLFFDRKYELEHMQKVLWSIIDNNHTKNHEQQNPPDIQIKAIEQLHIVSDKLVHLYHRLPFEVEFGAKRHFYIREEDAIIFTPEQQRRLDKFAEATYQLQYEKDFAEMKKKYPNLSDEQIDEKMEEQIEKEETQKDTDNLNLLT